MKQVLKQRHRATTPNEAAIDDWPEPVDETALDASTNRVLDEVDQRLDS